MAEAEHSPKPLVGISTEELDLHKETLGQAASAILLGLAAGQYDEEVKAIRDALQKIGIAFPPAEVLNRALGVFLVVNRLSVPIGPVVPDGQGGMVPASNSRYDPKTGKFL